MKSLALSILAVAVQGNASAEFKKEQQKLACYIYTDFEFYSILPLSTEQNYHATAASGASYEFNFCKFDLTCPNSAVETLATQTKAQVCLELSGNTPAAIKSEALASTKNTPKTLKLTYSQGAKCASDS